MKALAVIPLPLETNGSPSPSSLSTEELIPYVTGAFTKIRDAYPYIVELRRRFLEAPRGKANIGGCQTWEEFCEKHLSRNPSRIRQLLEDNNPASTGGVESTCEWCGEIFPSKNTLRRHEHKNHEDKITARNEAGKAQRLATEPSKPEPQEDVAEQDDLANNKKVHWQAFATDKNLNKHGILREHQTTELSEVTCKKCLKHLEELFQNQEESQQEEDQQEESCSPNRFKSHRYIAGLGKLYNTLKEVIVTACKGGFQVVDSKGQRIAHEDWMYTASSFFMCNADRPLEKIFGIFKSKKDANATLDELREVVTDTVDKYTDQDLCTVTLRCCETDFTSLEEVQKHRKDVHGQQANGGNFRKLNKEQERSQPDPALVDVNTRQPNQNYNRAGTRGFKDKPHVNLFWRRLNAIGTMVTSEFACTEHKASCECDSIEMAESIVWVLRRAICQLEEYRKEWEQKLEGARP